MQNYSPGVASHGNSRSNGLVCLSMPPRVSSCRWCGVVSWCWLHWWCGWCPRWASILPSLMLTGSILQFCIYMWSFSFRGTCRDDHMLRILPAVLVSLATFAFTSVKGSSSALNHTPKYLKDHTFSRGLASHIIDYCRPFCLRVFAFLVPRVSIRGRSRGLSAGVIACYMSCECGFLAVTLAAFVGIESDS